MPNRGAVTITPGKIDQIIQTGYHNGLGKVAGVPVPAEKVLADTTIAGTPGTMPNRSVENVHMPGLESTVWAGDRFFIKPPQGHYNGETWVTTLVPGLTPANLRAGVNVAGLVGTLSAGGRSLVTSSPMPKSISAPNTWVYHDLFTIPPSDNYVDVYTTANNNVSKLHAQTKSDDFSTIKTVALVLIDEAGVVYTLSTRTSGGADLFVQLTGFNIDRKQRTGIMYSPNTTSGPVGSLCLRSQPTLSYRGHYGFAAHPCIRATIVIRQQKDMPET